MIDVWDFNGVTFYKSVIEFLEFYCSVPLSFNSMRPFITFLQDPRNSGAEILICAAFDRSLWGSRWHAQLSVQLPCPSRAQTRLSAVDSRIILIQQCVISALWTALYVLMSFGFLICAIMYLETVRHRQNVSLGPHLTFCIILHFRGALSSAPSGYPCPVKKPLLRETF